MRAILAWPKYVADFFRRISVPCNHKTHTTRLIGEEAFAARIYPEVVAETVALSHLVAPGREGLSVAMLANLTPQKVNHVRFLWDSGATESFVTTDSDCAPGTDGPPTVSSVGVGKSGMSMQPRKSCLIPVSACTGQRADSYGQGQRRQCAYSHYVGGLHEE